MISRPDVYAAIDGERDYQDTVWPENSGGQQTVAGYLVMLAKYLRDAEHAWTTNPGAAPVQALDVVRKIGGIAVHCMEDHGAPRRAGF